MTPDRVPCQACGRSLVCVCEHCHLCGEFHEMAITPFPFIDWICPYRVGEKAYDARVAARRREEEGGKP